MREIDMHTWPRREHFRLYNAFNHPHFSMCANVDITSFYPTVKEHGVSITVAIVYATSRAANSIPEFRYRIREEKVIEHEVVHPSVTILTDDDLFSFCEFNYTENFSRFAANAERSMADARDRPTLKDEPGRDDYLFMTAIPWVSFTSFTHPMRLHPADSIPRFAWGKFFEEGGLMKMPLEVQGHHAVMDGLHMGRFYTAVQNYLHQPDLFLGGT